MNYLQITAGTTTIKAEIYDTPTAQELLKSLPIKSKVNRWGGEIYFTIPVSVPLEDDSRDGEIRVENERICALIAVSEVVCRLKQVYEMGGFRVGSTSINNLENCNEKKPVSPCLCRMYCCCWDVVGAWKGFG